MQIPGGKEDPGRIATSGGHRQSTARKQFYVSGFLYYWCGLWFCVVLGCLWF